MTLFKTLVRWIRSVLLLQDFCLFLRRCLEEYAQYQRILILKEIRSQIIIFDTTVKLLGMPNIFDSVLAISSFGIIFWSTVMSKKK